MTSDQFDVRIWSGDFVALRVGVQVVMVSAMLLVIAVIGNIKVYNRNWLYGYWTITPVIMEGFWFFVSVGKTYLT